MAENSKIEEWRRVEDSEPGIEVSNLGRVRRTNGSLILASLDRYWFVRIQVGHATRKRVKKYIHRLVAAAFVPRPSLAHGHVNHIDGDKLNNSSHNLEWTTQKGNNRHAYRTGLIPSGGNHHWAKLSDDDVAEIRAARGIVTQSELARRYRVSQSNISAIQLGKSHDSHRRCANGC